MLYIRNNVVYKINIKNIMENIILFFLFISIAVFSIWFLYKLKLSELIVHYMILGLIVLVSVIYIALIPWKVKHQSIIKVNSEGICDETGILGIPFLSWKHVKSIEICDHYGQKCIGISVYDLNELKMSVRTTRMKDMKVNEKFHLPHFLFWLFLNDRQIQSLYIFLNKELDVYRENINSLEN